MAKAAPKKAPKKAVKKIVKKVIDDLLNENSESEKQLDEPIYESKVTEDTQVSKPNYVEQEYIRLKELGKLYNANLAEKDFLSALILKATTRGWDSPIITDLKQRLETL